MHKYKYKCITSVVKDCVTIRDHKGEKCVHVFIGEIKSVNVYVKRCLIV